MLYTHKYVKGMCSGAFSTKGLLMVSVSSSNLKLQSCTFQMAAKDGSKHYILEWMTWYYTRQRYTWYVDCLYG
jgi:hypothetical protein